MRVVTRQPASTVAVCTLAIGVGAALGFVPGYVATELQSALDISRAQVGLLISLYFGATGVASVLGGRLTDRYGARRVVTADMALVAGCATAGAVTEHYWVLLLTSVLAGSGYAWANAGTNQAIAHHVAVHRRTLSMSVKTAGVPSMAALAAALGTPIASRWSWQVVWLIIAAIAMASAVATWIVLDDDRGERDLIRSTERHALPAGMWWFGVAAFLFIAGSQPLFSWLVPYLEESLDVAAGPAGAIAAAASAVGVVHLLVNGMLSDRRGAERRIDRLTTLVAVAALSMIAVWAGTRIGVLSVAVGAIVGVSVQLAAIGTMHAVLVDRAPQAVARATGVTMTGYYLGALVSPVCFGALVDATGSYTWGWLILVASLTASIPAWRLGGRVPIAATERLG